MRPPQVRLIFPQVSSKYFLLDAVTHWRQ